MFGHQPEEFSGLASPLTRTPQSAAELNPFLGEPEYQDEKPYYDDPDQKSTVTPERQSANPLLRDSSPRSAKSGIIFGSPRKTASPELPNPFADLQSAYEASTGQVTTARQVALPARALRFAKYDALSQHGKPETETYYASPDKQQLYEDDQSVPGSPEPDEDLDLDEEKTLEPYVQEKAESFALLSKKKRFSKYRSWPYYLLGLVLLLASIMGALAVYFTFSFKPHAYYKGALTASTGTVNSTGIEFSRHITLGFTNPNLYNLPMTEVEVWPLYDGSNYFGYTKMTRFDVSIPKHAKLNATLPIQQSFSYVSKNDPKGTLLKKMYQECQHGRRVPFTLKVHAKVKLFGYFTVPVSLKRVTRADMDCGDNLSSMIQTMFTLKGLAPN